MDAQKASYPGLLSELRLAASNITAVKSRLDFILNKMDERGMPEDEGYGADSVISLTSYLNRTISRVFQNLGDLQDLIDDNSPAQPPTPKGR